MIKRIGVGVCGLWLVVLFGGRSEAATRTVCASGCNYTDIQAAIDAAARGDTILLRAGQTFVGHYILRAKPGTGSIVIRSDAADSNLPGPGVRLVPSGRPGANTSRALLPRLIGRGGAYKTTPLIKTAPGANGYVIRFVEFDGTAHLGYETLVQLGEDTTATPAYDITLDRVYIHGDPYRGQKRAITMNAERLALLNSYIADIKAINADAQAIVGYNGAGPFTIENNYLEASGENVMFGGADPAVADLVPSNITMRRNHFYKPLSWRSPILSAPSGVRATSTTGGALASGTHYFRVVALMSSGSATGLSVPSAAVSASVGASGAVTISWSRVTGAERYRVYRGSAAGTQTVYLETTATSLTYTGSGERSGSPAAGGTKWLVKNLFELKNAANVTLDGNILENSWAAGQVGYAIVLTPRNNGRAPWTRIQNVTFTNNIIRHVAGVANITGYDDDGDPTLRTERITFRNNLFEDVNHSAYGTNARVILAGNGAAYLTIDSNTTIHTNTAVLYAYGTSMPGLVYTNNNSKHLTYGIMGQGSSVGTPTLTRFFPGATVRCNVLAGGNASSYPAQNFFPSVTDWTASFVDPANGDYALRPGSVVASLGCNEVDPGADMAAVESATTGTPAEAATPAPDEPAPAPNQAPVADAGGPYTTTVNSLVSADGTSSSDPEGSVLDYRWHWGDEIVVRAANLPRAALRGSEWVVQTAADAAGGRMILNPNLGRAKKSAALAAPASYVEFTINAAAGVPYRLWMRMKATGDAYANDSLYVQFNGAVDANGTPLARIGTTAGLPLILEQGTGAGISGWGWTDSAWEAVAAPIYFARGGLQTIRIQSREDGVAWDQLVLSSGAFSSAPGPAKRDTTHLDDELGTSTGVSGTHRFGRTGTFPLLLVVTDAAGATGSASTTVTVR